ncbi:cupin domain-containing protein [Sandaracinus amylolyticus]|uniref:cupin domain-containing protein n=1 Tax=Sandaracinus amylolyticus TaxID=927083 RepID=UPI001F30EC84|nr:cupin domain-containing protein [Sandaracinus amylolyticus]UJR86416.1 Hypothetical protein I5071_85110 [Sandaracinus amylolyticus]
MTTTRHRSHHDRSFEPFAPGIHICVLRRHETGPGVTLLVRMDAGAHAPRHHHPGGEETFILSGTLRAGGKLLSAGDYLYTPPGEVHDGHAKEECTFLLVLPGGLELTRDAA